MHISRDASDEELDRLLAATAPAVAVDQAPIPRIVRGARLRAGSRWGARRIAAGALVLAVMGGGVAAASSALGWGNLTPVQSDGIYRTGASIRLDWTRADGSTAACSFNPEYSLMPSNTSRRLETYLSNYDSDQLNRRLIQSGEIRTYDTSGADYRAVRSAAQEAVDRIAGPHAPRVTGLVVRCGSNR